MTRTDPYALHREPVVDAQHAYCKQARATLDRLAARRRPTLARRIRNLFRRSK